MISVRPIVIAVATTCMVGGVAAVAPAQTCMYSNTITDLTQSGAPAVRGQTVPSGGNCSNRNHIIFTSIEGLATTCTAGQKSGAYCIADNTQGTATSTALGNSCGLWKGQTEHVYQVLNPPSGLIHIQSQEKLLNAGSCVPDCEALYGVGWYWDGWQCTNNPSPIVIALHEREYRFTSAARGVQFDIDGDGDLDQVAWTYPQSEVSFLAYDADGDGLITSGKELFGNHTLQGAGNGFEALAKLAQATNGGIERASVSEDDPFFFQLLLWTDRNHNGVSEPEELRPVGEVISTIGLGYTPVGRRDRHGNAFGYQGWAHRRTSLGRNRARFADEDVARRLVIWDMFFVRQPEP